MLNQLFFNVVSSCVPGLGLLKKQRPLVWSTVHRLNKLLFDMHGVSTHLRVYRFTSLVWPSFNKGDRQDRSAFRARKFPSNESFF